MLEVATINLPPEENLDLPQWITFLNANSDFQFIKVSNKYISVIKKEIFVCGFVMDKDTGEPIPYITVTDGTAGTISNEQGFFKIEVSGRSANIQIRHLGYKALIRQAKFFNNSECQPVYLVPDPEELAEIVVYDFLVRGMDRLDDGSVQIDFDRFDILPGLIENDVLHSVQALPGIISTDETVSNLNIRGGSNDQNLITWDGIKMYQTGHFFGLISMYNPHITKKLTLQKNGSRADLTDGVSGTIAMQTEEYLTTKFEGGLGLNFIDGNGYVDTPLGEKASIQVAARKSIGDYLETPTYSNYNERVAQNSELDLGNADVVITSKPEFDFYDASFRLLYNLTEKDGLRLNFINTANEVAFNETATVGDRDEVRRSTLTQKSIAGGLQYHREWDNDINTDISIYETFYRLKSINADIPKEQRFLQVNEVSETGIKLNIDKSFSQQTSFGGGYQFTETKITNLDDVDDPFYMLLEADVLRTHALYSQLGLATDSRNTKFNIGLRLNYLEKFKRTLLEPRLSLTHKFSDFFQFEILGEFKHQNTSQIINFQNDFLGLENRRWQLSNNGSIPVITSTQLSAGIGYNQEQWMFDCVFYYKDVQGITTQSQGFQDGYEFSKSAGSYSSNGLDFLLRRQAGNSSVWVSYSYLNSEYRFDDLPETRFPNNYNITHAATLGATRKFGKFIIAPGLNWRSGKPYTPAQEGNEVTEDNINYGMANSIRQITYLRVDVSGEYLFSWGKSTTGRIGLSFWNLLDKNNINNTFFRLDADQQLQRFEQNALDFTPNLSLRLDFN